MNATEIIRDAEAFARVDRLDAPPVSLWAVGNLDLLTATAPRVMVTGARACTSYGSHVTTELVANMHRGVHLVTGLAYGVEGDAVRAALATGRPVIVVAAGGLDRPYPSGHTELHDRVIAAGGVVVSAAAPGQTPTRARFVARSEIAAALADAVIVTEAGSRSGALHTITTARTLGTPYGAVPGPITSAASVGTNAIIRDGGAVITSAADVDALTLAPVAA